MKLNPECIRDIMFYLEENLTMNSDLEINEISIFDLPEKLNYSIDCLYLTMRILSFVTETMEMTQLLLLIYTALHIQAINFLKAYVLIQFGKKCKRSVVT